MTPERYARVKAISHEFNERPLLERNRFLDEACDGDCESRWGQTDAFRWWQTHAGRFPHEPAAQPPAATFKPLVR